jgi:signal transduction histidine kinase
VLKSYWRAYRPPTVDVLIAAAFIVFGQLVTWFRLDGPDGYVGPRPLNAILNALFLAALAWRRRAPLAAVCWAVGVYFLPTALVPHDITFAAGGIPLIFLTASAGYHCSRRRAVLAAAVAMAGLATITLTMPYLRSPSAFLWNTLFMLVPWFGARALREREDRAATLAAALATERASKEVALRDAANAERAHIARELHDIVAHSVSMMVIQIGAARMQLQAGAGSAQEPLLDAEDVGRQTLDDLRRLLGVLRADEPDARDPGDDSVTGAQPPQPGLTQVEAMLPPLRAAGLDVEMEVDGEPVPLPAALDLTCFRIIQEALTNTLKHGGATRASVQLRYTPDALLIAVADDGTAAPPVDRVGHGLVGIGERVALFGGTAKAGPGRGGGWRVHVELPLPAPTAHDLRAAIPSS